MKITINGESEDVDGDRITVTALLKLKDVEMPEMVSVEKNEEIIEREAYDTTEVVDGDTIEFLYFMGGGASA